ncbi:Do family serine endopeptidase [Pedobacter arcticus]|uniref:Do family serine endopeptidase n=1 Tax=Pedobacter arcticus TaxID=752140 RepID=UPI0002F0429E|nr:Do family serine endopeptidase [Pedobacter arcticus]
MNSNMKKIGFTLLTAFVGGAVAIGAYKLLEPNTLDGLSLSERQKVYFANNPSEITASTGAVDFTQAAAAVSPGVVHVRTTYSRSKGQAANDPFGDMFEDFFGRRRQSTPQKNAPAPMGKGSGVIVTGDGYIMTNNHVVEDAEKIEVILSDKRVLEAKVIGRDKNTDLALIKISATDLPIVKLGNSDDVRVGEWVLAVGFPLTLESTVTAGIVSAKSRQIGILAPEIDRNSYDPNNPPTNSSIESFIQTDAVINRGNSGGALVNTRGELIGINSAIASQSGTYEGYGFAIPVNLAKKVMDDFLKFGEVKRGFIGVTFQELNADVAKDLKVSEIDGLYINSTLEDGAAEKAGIKKGDIIKQLDGQEISSSARLQERVGTMRPGDKITLGVLRDGKMKNFSVTLKGSEGNKLASNSKEVTEVVNSLGATFSPLTDVAKKKYGINSGVVVTSVAPGKVFDMYDMPKGTVITTVNGRGVNNNDQVVAALKQDTKMVALQGFVPDGSRFRVTFPVK